MEAYEEHPIELIDETGGSVPLLCEIHFWLEDQVEYEVEYYWFEGRQYRWRDDLMGRVIKRLCDQHYTRAHLDEMHLHDDAFSGDAISQPVSQPEYQNMRV